MNEQQAIEIAAKYAKEQGWTWLEPVSCRRPFRFFGPAVYEVRTNCESRGANIVIKIYSATGTIKQANFLPR